VSTIAALGRALRRGATTSGALLARAAAVAENRRDGRCSRRRPGELPVGVQLEAGRTDRVLAVASLVDGGGMWYMM